MEKSTNADFVLIIMQKRLKLSNHFQHFTAEYYANNVIVLIYIEFCYISLQQVMFQ